MVSDLFLIAAPIDGPNPPDGYLAALRGDWRAARDYPRTLVGEVSNRAVLGDGGPLRDWLPGSIAVIGSMFPVRSEPRRLTELLSFALSWGYECHTPDISKDERDTIARGHDFLDRHGPDAENTPTHWIGLYQE